MLALRDCPEGSRVAVAEIDVNGPLKQRLLEMGFLPGRKVRVIRNAPLRDPMEVEIMGYQLAIRKDDARFILVE